MLRPTLCSGDMVTAVKKQVILQINKVGICAARWHIAMREPNSVEIMLRVRARSAAGVEDRREYQFGTATATPLINTLTMSFLSSALDSVYTSRS